MFNQVSNPAVRRRSPLAIVASVAGHSAVCVAVIASAQAASSRLPPAPNLDLTFVNIVPAVPPNVVPVKSVVVLPVPLPTLTPLTPEIVPTASPFPALPLEVVMVQPKAEIAHQPLIKDATKPAPPVVVGAFASVAPAEAARAVNKQLASTAFDLEQAKSPDLKLRQSAVGAFDQSSSKEAQPGSDRAKPNAVADAGFGSSPSVGREGASSSPGPIGPAQGAGFDTAPSAGARRVETQQVQPTSFNASPAAKAEKPPIAQGGVSVPVEVVFKPAPTYTPEARNLKIEGDVVLEVDFRASGQVRVVRVIQGLGHGLDETAASAAEHIRFKPARSASEPIDFRAIVHITFRLT
jgi:TonB family protein